MSLLVEYSIMFHCTPQQALKTQARLFFASLKQGREYIKKRNALELLDQCDIAAIPMCNEKYFEKVRTSIMYRIVPYEPPVMTQKPAEPEDVKALFRR